MNHDSLEYAQYKAQRIKNLIPEFNRSGINILDFGCGDGLMTNYLQEVFFEANVIGVDQSEEKVMRARKNYPGISFQHIAQKRLPFADNTFDALVAADVLHHISRSEHQRWLKELMRVLKPGGYFILLELNPWNIFTRREFKRNQLEKNAHMLSPHYAKKLLNNFGQSKSHYYYFFPKWFIFEPIIKKLPLSSLYSVSLQKDN